MAHPMNDPEYTRFLRLKDKWAALRAEFDKDEALIDQHYGADMIPDDWADDGLKPTLPPTASDAIENAADHILTFPRVFVPARPVTENIVQAQDTAERLRQFFSLFWGRVFEDGDPLGQGKKSLIKGMLVLKMEIRWDVIPEPPEVVDDAYRRKIRAVTSREFPWKITVVPKETVVADPNDTWNPRYVYEEYEIDAEVAIERFPNLPQHLKNMAISDPYTKLAYVEMWTLPRGNDPGKYVVWVDGERVHDERNPYSWQDADEKWHGYVPYLIGHPGWGDVDKDAAPEKVFVSAIRRARSVITSEARFLTELESWLRMYVWPTLNTKNMPDSEDAQIRLGPGGHIDRTEDQEVGVLTWGDVPAGLLQGLARVNAYVDQSTKFGTLGGIAQRGVDTASEADQNVRNASTKLSGPVNMLRRMVMRMNAWALMDIEHVLEVPVTVTGAVQNTPGDVTVKPSDIRGYYYTMVEMETSDEAALNLRTARVWGDMYRILPGLKEATVMEKVGINNPTEEQDGRAVEDMLRSAPFQQVLLLMGLAGMGEQAQAVQQALQSVLPQVLGGKSAPGQPGVNSAGLLTEGQGDGTGAPTASEAQAEARTMAPERMMQ